MILQRFSEERNLIKRVISTLVFTILLLVTIRGNAQKSIPFDLKFDLAPIHKDSISIEEFKFYVSDLILKQNNVTVYENKNLFKLVDLSEESSFTISTLVPSHLLFNSISFSLGVDSNTNKEGIHSGDLDPTKGMYWTWQSGYINLKLEGSSPLCPTRKHKFQFHIGGFGEGQYPLQTITYPALNNYKSTITIDLEKFFNVINLSKVNEVMIPGKQAVELSNKIKLAFDK